MRNAFKVLIGRPEKKTEFGKCWLRWDDKALHIVSL